MIEQIKKLLIKYKEQILYLIFGFLSTLLNIVIFFILNSTLSIEYQIANIIAWIIVVIFAFITNKIFVFESKKSSKKDVAKETISFFVARLITLLMEMLLLYLLIEKILKLEIIAKIIINIIVIIANYFFSKLIVFKKRL